MEANIDGVLRRVGSGMTHYHDEVALRNYIATLETRVLDAEAKWRGEWANAQTLRAELYKLKAQLTGPGTVAYVVFKPDEGESHETD
jgi:hypothetical protein